MDGIDVGIFPPYTMVDVYWGSPAWGVFKLGTCAANLAYGMAHVWFNENDHFFHIENFPPYQRVINNGECLVIDYGSHSNFVYLFPIE